MTYETNSLAHYGIKGQHWGQRRFQQEDGTLTAEGKARYGLGRSSSRLVRGLGNGRTHGVYDRGDGSKDLKRLQKDAKKDAEDMARAKAYYGEGAGNRRKQIRNRISERMKDPDYKAEYEKQLASQDMSKHQKAANRERHAQDAKNAAAKTARGIKNLIIGFGSASLTAVALYNAAKFTGADKKIAELGKKAINSIKNKATSMKKPSVKDYDWHSSGGSAYTASKNAHTQSHRDIRERTDRAKYDTQRPWIDKDGNIHYK